MVAPTHSEMISSQNILCLTLMTPVRALNLLLFRFVVVFYHKLAEIGLTNSWNKTQTGTCGESCLWHNGSVTGASWPETLEMLRSETLGKSTSNCSQKLLAGGAKKQ